MFEKGQSGNPNGRPAGALNKKTIEIKEMITQLLEAIDNKGIENLVNNVIEEKKSDVLIKAMTQLAPKDLNISGEIKTNSVVNELRKLRGEDDG